MPYPTISSAIEALGTIYLSDAVRGAEAEHGAPAVPAGDASLTDAHTYTRTLIRTDYPLLVAADQQFVHSNPNIDFAAMRTRLNQHLQSFSLQQFSQQERVALEEQLRLIQIFLTNTPNGVESNESMVHIPQLLSRTWHLAGLRAVRVASDVDPVSALTQVLLCVSSNITDRGPNGTGCMPGVVARLYAVYARLLFNELLYRNRAPAAEALPQQVRAPIPPRMDVLWGHTRDAEDELQRAVRPLAIAYSKQKAEQAKILEAINEDCTAHLLNNSNHAEQARELETISERQTANLLNVSQAEQARILEDIQAALPAWKRDCLISNMSEEEQLALAMTASLNIGHNLASLNSERQARLAARNHKHLH